MNKELFEESIDETVLEINEVEDDSNFLCCIITGGDRPKPDQPKG